MLDTEFVGGDSTTGGRSASVNRQGGAVDQWHQSHQYGHSSLSLSASALAKQQQFRLNQRADEKPSSIVSNTDLHSRDKENNVPIVKPVKGKLISPTATLLPIAETTTPSFGKPVRRLGNQPGAGPRVEIGGDNERADYPNTGDEVGWCL